MFCDSEVNLESKKGLRSGEDCATCSTTEETAKSQKKVPRSLPTTSMLDYLV